MREAYKQLRHYLQELDWVGSGLVYEGPLQGFQFLWQEEGVLWAPEGELETAKKMLLTIGEMKSCTTCEIGENHVFVEPVSSHKASSTASSMVSTGTLFFS